MLTSEIGDAKIVTHNDLRLNSLVHHLHDQISGPVRVVIYGPGSAKKPTIWPSFLGPAAAIIRGLSSSLRLSMSWAHASLQAMASHVLIGTYTLCRH